MHWLGNVHRNWIANAWPTSESNVMYVCPMTPMEMPICFLIASPGAESDNICFCALKIPKKRDDFRPARYHTARGCQVAHAARGGRDLPLAARRSPRRHIN